MRRLASSLALATLFAAMGCGGASALSLPFEESDYLPPEATTTYVERSLNHQAPLTIEHPPVERNPRGRRRGDAAAIAGYCGRDRHDDLREALADWALAYGDRNAEDHRLFLDAIASGRLEAAEDPQL